MLERGTKTNNLNIEKVFANESSFLFIGKTNKKKQSDPNKNKSGSSNPYTQQPLNNNVVNNNSTPKQENTTPTQQPQSNQWNNPNGYQNNPQPNPNNNQWNNNQWNNNQQGTQNTYYGNNNQYGGQRYQTDVSAAYSKNKKGKYINDLDNLLNGIWILAAILLMWGIGRGIWFVMQPQAIASSLTGSNNNVTYTGQTIFTFGIINIIASSIGVILLYRLAIARVEKTPIILGIVMIFLIGLFSFIVAIVLMFGKVYVPNSANPRSKQYFEEKYRRMVSMGLINPAVSSNGANSNNNQWNNNQQQSNPYVNNNPNPNNNQWKDPNFDTNNPYNNNQWNNNEQGPQQNPNTNNNQWNNNQQNVEYGKPFHPNNNQSQGVNNNQTNINNEKGGEFVINDKEEKVENKSDNKDQNKEK